VQPFDRPAPGVIQERARPRITSLRRTLFMIDAPFDTIESAHDFVRLLRKQVLIVELEIVEDIGMAAREGAARQLDALRLVRYKLTKLNDHLGAGSRILNDLRALRRLLTTDGHEPRRVPVPAALELYGPARAALDA
jgi:hypothetical protein